MAISLKCPAPVQCRRLIFTSSYDFQEKRAALEERAAVLSAKVVPTYLPSLVSGSLRCTLVLALAAGYCSAAVAGRAAASADPFPTYHLMCFSPNSVASVSRCKRRVAAALLISCARAHARFVMSNTSQRLTASASAHDALQREALEGQTTARAPGKTKRKTSAAK